MSFFDDLEKKAQERKDYLSFDKQIDLINKNIATPSIINANDNLTQEQVDIKDQALADKQQRANSELMAAPVGMLEGMVGFGGDIERLGRGAVGAVTANNGERWDSFLNELGNKDTTLWNTENVQDWTNKQLEGTDFGNRLLEGKGGRLFGEILAPAPPIAGAMKYGGKALDFLDEGATFANKYLNKFDIQPGLSIKSVDNAYRPGYVYKTVNTVNGKKYIGSKLSRQGHSGKFFDPNYYGSGVDLNKAIDKYGKDKFINVKEMDTKTFNGMKNAEEGLLTRVDAGGSKDYYNRHNRYSSGGDAPKTELHKEQTSIAGKKDWERRRAEGTDKFPNRKKVSKEDAINMAESRAEFYNTKEGREMLVNRQKGKGIKEWKAKNGEIRWEAKQSVNGKQYKKRFLTKEEAATWKNDMANRYINNKSFDDLLDIPSAPRVAPHNKGLI